MDYQSDPLWQHIRDFSFDEPGITFPFSKKLAKEQNWYNDFTLLAIEEYQKFIYLCCISPSGASPSQIVDEVWHLHLTYTVNYWIRFCKETLHQDIHHHPSQGGDTDKTKHDDWYADTLDLYRTTFNEEPPEVIWPKPAPHFTIPDADQPPELRKFNYGLFLLLLIPFALITVLYGQPIPFLLSGPHYIVFYTVLIGLCIYIALQLRNVRKHNLIAYFYSAAHNLSKYKLAFLTGGPKRYTLLHLSDLIRDEVLVHLKKNMYTIDKIKARYSNSKIANELASYKTDTIHFTDVASMIGSETEAELFDLRILKSRHRDNKTKWVIAIVAIIFSVPRLVQGTVNGQAVVILGFISFFAFFIFLALLQNPFHYFADKFLRNTPTFTAHINDDISSRIIFSGVLGITGMQMFSHLGSRHFNFDSSSGGGCGSSGCGSSCGSSCGGGCGGCGGD